MDTVDTAPKKRGGARPGAGRPRNRMIRSRHTVYCSFVELDLVKALLRELRAVSKLEEMARKEHMAVIEKYGKDYVGELPPRAQYVINQFLAADKALKATTVKDLAAIADEMEAEKLGIVADDDDE